MVRATVYSSEGRVSVKTMNVKTSKKIKAVMNLPDSIYNGDSIKAFVNIKSELDKSALVTYQID